MLKLSIIIPVYNEENYLKACLDSLAAQSVKPLEVIVIDNNSSDASMEIARRYTFVKILSESRQGQVFAQAKGFNAAKGEIFGRIDADSVLPIDWVEKVTRLFVEEPDVVGLTGDADPYDAPLKSVAGAVFRFYHSFVSRLASGHVMLWGANCAFRKAAWHQVKKQGLFRRDIWEDYELAFLLAPLGQIRHLPGLRVGCSFRAAHLPLRTQWSYQYRAIRTFHEYTNTARTALFALIWHSMLLLFPLAMLDHILSRSKH